MTNKKSLLRLMLGLVCSAAILWLGVACGEEVDPDYPCGQDALRHAIKVREVLMENRQLLNHQFFDSDDRIMEHFFRDIEGNWSDEYGIVLMIAEKLDQEMLPPEHRIYDDLEGVRVFNNEDYSYSGGFWVTDQEIPELHYWYAVMRKHEDLLLDYPNAMLSHIGTIVAYGERPGEPMSLEIVIPVTEKVDPATLPPENRIPDCLEGLPTRIQETKPDSE